jgi:hypothetical protein
LLNTLFGVCHESNVGGLMKHALLVALLSVFVLTCFASDWEQRFVEQHQEWYHVSGAVDMDGDGDMDFVGTVSPDDGNGTVSWWENDGNSIFTEHVIIDENHPDILSPQTSHGDLDNDGDVDIVTINANSGFVTWLENDGNQNFSLNVTGDNGRG